MRDEIWDRHEEEASESLLISVVDQLDNFDFYVLDKILEYARQPTVLDVRYYANDPEILALLDANQLNNVAALSVLDMGDVRLHWYVSPDGRQYHTCREYR